MFSIDEIKKKREMYERKIEKILEEFKNELPQEVTIDNAVATRHGTCYIECSIKLVVEDLNK
jgi:hypothetical protein